MVLREENDEGIKMSDQVIVRRTGTYGRITVTLPMPIKTSIMEWAKKSGLRKSEFFRMSMMMGSAELAEKIKAKEPNEGFLDDV